MEESKKHFKELYTEEGGEDIALTNELLGHIPQLVSKDDNEEMEIPVSKSKVSNGLWSMDPDKAPGLDGFSAHFYRICWGIIKKDLLRLVRNFQRKEKLGGGINSTFLFLSPKENNPSNFGRFRPISLCNVSYKLCSKLLANRIKPHLHKLISQNQGGFIKGRQILDNVILVQEAIHASKGRKEKGMIIKLDMANAFDRVNHEFLLKVLEKFGFSEKIISMIKCCIGNPWIAPLINRRPTEFFESTRGIRQGCPLSPFLYIIMPESLSRKLLAEKEAGNIPGIKIAQGVQTINHALFVDDVICLGGASVRIAKKFKKILLAYCRASGGKININKSEIFGWNIDQSSMNKIASALDMKGHDDWEKFKYLGLPIFLGNNKGRHWQEVMEKIQGKINF